MIEGNDKNRAIGRKQGKETNQGELAGWVAE